MEWLLGGAAVWLLFSAFGARQSGGAGAKPAGSGGPGTQGGGISTTTALQAGVGVVGVGATVAAPLVAHAAGSGAVASTGGGGAAAAGGTGGSTTTATAQTGAEVADAFATTVDTSVAGAAAAAGFMVAAALAFVALGLALNSEASQATLAGLRQVASNMFNRYTRRIFGGELSMFDSLLTTATQALNQSPGPYLNMNPASARSAQIASSNLVARQLGPGTPLPIPSSSTPYGFTRCDLVNDDSCGVNSADPNVATYASELQAGGYSFYTNSVDPRLPVDLLMRSRAFYRWMQWTVNAQMNTCLSNYYPYKDRYRGQGEDSSEYWLTPANFDTYTSQFFQNMPAAMQPPKSVTWNDYPSLLSQATSYIALYNKANPSRPVSFNQFIAGVRFVGTANAAIEASYIGMGANDRQWTSGWPGDQQFTALMLDSLGLFAAGWTYSTWIAPNVGPNPILLGYDPASGCLYDFVNAHNNPQQGVMYQFPLGTNITNATTVIPLDANSLFNLPSAATLQQAGTAGAVSGFAGVRRPFAGFANMKARGLRGLGRYAAIAPSWRGR